MVSREEFASFISELKKGEIDILETNKKEKKEKEIEHIRHWTTLYRRNLDLFNHDYLGISTAFFQDIMINTMADNEVCDDVCSRGLSKTYCTALFAMDWALLYPESKILITAKTLTQANLIVDEKINKIFCSKGTPWSSPILCRLRDDGWLKFGVDKETGGKTVTLGNGSEILSAPCIDSLRGKRSTVLITDEFVLVKKVDYDEIASPTLEVRKFKGRPADYTEETKQIFLSSAKTKINWGWNHVKECVEKHYKGGDVKYGFYAGDIFTAIASGIQTKKQYIQRKSSTDEISFLQEYLNIWLGNGEKTLLKYEDFERNQIIKEAFYPRTPMEYLEGVEQTWRFRSDNDEIRFVATDIAVSVGAKEDNTAIILGSLNLRTGLREVYYVHSINGMNTLEQAALFKRLFYEWKAKYFVMDSTGIGNVLFDLLTQETYDDQINKTYPAWTVNSDSMLQIVSSAVQNDKIQRTISDKAEEVIVPIVGTASLNTEMHLALRKNLRENKIKFLIDDADAQSYLEKQDKLWVTKSSEYRAEKILPYLKTRFMINESVSVEAEIKDNGNIKAVEKTSGNVTTKDLFMALDYFNYFSDKLAVKYLKEENEDTDDFNIDDWAFLATMCQV
jgi:hypothetical protein